MKITKFKNLFLNIVGIFLILFGIYAIDYSIWVGSAQWALWLCYWSMIIMGYGILIRSSYLVMSQLNIITIPLLFWIGDFFYYLFFRSSLFGIVDYFFQPMAIGARIISLEHLFLLPLGFGCLYLLNIKTSRAWVLSFLQLALFFALSRVFTGSESNVNWVYNWNISIVKINNWQYPAVWFILSLSFVALVDYLTGRFIYGLKDL